MVEKTSNMPYTKILNHKFIIMIKYYELLIHINL